MGNGFVELSVSHLFAFMFTSKSDFREGWKGKAPWSSLKGFAVFWLEQGLARLSPALCGGAEWKLGVRGMKSLTSLFLLPQFGGERGGCHLLSI